MATMQCDVVSVQESLYSGTVTMLIAKGAGGELGIMPGHAPLVTLLQPGAIRVILENGTEELIYVSGGVLEVQPHVVTVLADTAVRAENLDEAAIIEARKHAEQLLANQKSDLDSAAALAALAETAAQLETIRKIKTVQCNCWFKIEKPPFWWFLWFNFSMFMLINILIEKIKSLIYHNYCQYRMLQQHIKTKSF